MQTDLERRKHAPGTTEKKWMSFSPCSYKSSIFICICPWCGVKNKWTPTRYDIYMKSKSLLSLITCGSVLYKEWGFNFLDYRKGLSVWPLKWWKLLTNTCTLIWNFALCCASLGPETLVSDCPNESCWQLKHLHVVLSGCFCWYVFCNT